MERFYAIHRLSFYISYDRSSPLFHELELSRIRHGAGKMEAVLPGRRSSILKGWETSDGI